jgi:hypothetical protein
MIGSQDMLVGMVHSALRNDNGALADALPNHGRRLFGSQGDTTCTSSDERTMQDRLIRVTASLALLQQNSKPDVLATRFGQAHPGAGWPRR